MSITLELQCLHKVYLFLHFQVLQCYWLLLWSGVVKSVPRSYDHLLICCAPPPPI
jgi:hypothetical protein